MNLLNFETLNKTLEGSKAIQLHRTSFEHFLTKMPKSDPFYDELEQLIQLSDKCKDLEVRVATEDAQTIHQFNALSDQLSSKLNSMVLPTN
ncbi:hypothetical protein BCT96_019325 [Vibrio splendidus]|uniref:hypothetical protein n=1 Tax=Vibrio splendidus TaxID=29497 RepID=UPI0000670E08|nr:hypothetical protein [Vibrio splendidus]EAP93423.1 hypothetical protein V12B01_23879 [Vibrio splendidus 12B01]PMI77414.1 hypothetical protein BCU37_21620 [Vibrio splendidus]PMK55048.1 hypothetical protein BCT96_21920 [Vibrio splendidus]